MRIPLFMILLVLLVPAAAQDHIYLLDGSKRTCTVNEVRQESIELMCEDGPSVISIYDILLIEYRNGRVEYYNKPSRNLVIGGADPDLKDRAVKKNENAFKPSFLSINTLALSNADVSLFYEYRKGGKDLGLGIMGAYNFNLRSTLQNAYISVLHNGKKNFDAGVYVNYYVPLNTIKRTELVFGVMMKYCDLRFNKVVIDSVPGVMGSTQLLSYQKHKGAQWATLFSGGYQVTFDHDIFLKGMAGIGAFKARGVYQEELKKILNEGNGPGEPELPVRTLLKLYLSVNIGIQL